MWCLRCLLSAAHLPIGIHYLWLLALSLLSFVFLTGCANLDQINMRVAPEGTPITFILKVNRPIPHYSQATDNSCWLACTRMVNAYYGVKVSEDQLKDKVSKITYSKQENLEKVTIRVCLIALAQEQGWIEKYQQVIESQKGSKNGTNIKIKFDVGDVLIAVNEGTRIYDFNELIDALDKGEPAIIVCLLSPDSDERHAMVLTGLFFGPVGDKYGLVAAQVLDPADKEGKPKLLPAEHIHRNLRAVYTRSIAKSILESEMKAIQVSQ